MRKAFKIMDDKKAIAAFETIDKAMDYIKAVNNPDLSIKAVNLCKSVISLIICTDYTYLYKPMPETWKEFFPVITVNELADFGLNTTVKHTGKMSGMFSWSTTCRCNADCIKKIRFSYEKLGIDICNMKNARKEIKKFIQNNPFSTDVLICGFCFSDSQQDTFPSMTIGLEKNFIIFNNGVIHDDYIPVLNNLYFRGESFGDFASVNAVINFYKLAAKNPLVRVTAWTKNLVFFYLAEEDGYKKPENFTLIFSSSYINKPAKIPEKVKHLVDKRFTVYTKEYAERYNIRINCGARACLACLRCYSSTCFDIAELLK